MTLFVITSLFKHVIFEKRPVKIKAISVEGLEGKLFPICDAVIGNLVSVNERNADLFMITVQPS